jgi:hypothetical protein
MYVWSTWVGLLQCVCVRLGRTGVHIPLKHHICVQYAVAVALIRTHESSPLICVT